MGDCGVPCCGAESLWCGSAARVWGRLVLWHVFAKLVCYAFVCNLTNTEGKCPQVGAVSVRDRWPAKRKGEQALARKDCRWCSLGMPELRGVAPSDHGEYRRASVAGFFESWQEQVWAAEWLGAILAFRLSRQMARWLRVSCQHLATFFLPPTGMHGTCTSWKEFVLFVCQGRPQSCPPCATSQTAQCSLEATPSLLALTSLRCLWLTRASAFQSCSQSVEQLLCWSCCSTMRNRKTWRSCLRTAWQTGETTLVYHWCPAPSQPWSWASLLTSPQQSKSRACASSRPSCPSRPKRASLFTCCILAQNLWLTCSRRTLIRFAPFGCSSRMAWFSA